MALPVNTVKFEASDEVVINNSINITPDQGVKIVDTSNSTTKAEDDAGVTYFVDEEGHYYYQPAPDLQNIVIAENVTENREISNFTMKNESSFQTVTLVPSETADGEFNYVLIVQEPDEKFVETEEVTEEKPLIDLNSYDFDEGDVEENSSVEDNEQIMVKREISGKGTVRPQFTCTYCKYTSPRRYLLLRHMKSHSDERPYKCRVCERGFKLATSLVNHINTHNGVKRHVCKECGHKFTTSGELIRHVRYKHTHEKPHKCTECDYASVEMSKLRRHMRCHTGERPYQCPHCTYASPDTFKLKRHLRTHTGERPYTCDSCHMSFTQSNSLKSHMSIHNFSTRPVYSCEMCPTTCGRKTDLRIHVQKMHSPGQLHKCKTCGIFFTDRYSWKVHTKSHRGEKCFKCDVCPYACAALRHLQSHALNHTNEKPFKCSECNACFRQKQLLRRHQNLYHDPTYVPRPPKAKDHECRDCGRRFAHQGNLLRHLHVHDPASTHREDALALRRTRRRRAQIDEANGPNETHKASDAEQDEMKKDVAQTVDIVTVIAEDGGRIFDMQVAQSEDGDSLASAPYTDDSVDYLEDDSGNQNADTRKAAGSPLDAQSGSGGEAENDVESCFGFDISTGS